MITSGFPCDVACGNNDSKERILLGHASIFYRHSIDESSADRWSTLHGQTTIPAKFIPFHSHLRAQVSHRFTRPPHKSLWPPGDPKPEPSCSEVPVQHCVICPHFPQFTADKHETIITPALWQCVRHQMNPANSETKCRATAYSLHRK